MVHQGVVHIHFAQLNGFSGSFGGEISTPQGNAPGLRYSNPPKGAIYCGDYTDATQCHTHIGEGAFPGRPDG
jgi:hypothetical protein